MYVQISKDYHILKLLIRDILYALLYRERRERQSRQTGNNLQNVQAGLVSNFQNVQAGLVSNLQNVQAGLVSNILNDIKVNFRNSINF